MEYLVPHHLRQAFLLGVVEMEFRQLDEQEKIARSALARLEAGVIRRFLELDEIR
jgi:F-type H+-transporting ATPase subunit epsilon